MIWIRYALIQIRNLLGSEEFGSSSLIRISDVYDSNHKASWLKSQDWWFESKTFKPSVIWITHCLTWITHLDFIQISINKFFTLLTWFSSFFFDSNHNISWFNSISQVLFLYFLCLTSNFYLNHLIFSHKILMSF